ncbi:MAG TPA: UDP-N-acetylmuramate dehydrogenase [Oscillospiraceae bacterium]|nr:UDP-N-acetylmuramate dehydrogenase [Oscillospiraceae bacterium]
MNNITSIIDLAVSKGCGVKRNESLKRLTTFKTGGTAAAVVTPKTVGALSEVLMLCKKLNVKIALLGNGSNTLALDSGFDGIIISTTHGLNELYLTDECTIFANAGVTLSKLSSFAYENGLSGAEFLYGIPGSVGGAAFMNAGAYGGEMKDIAVYCTHLDLDFNIGKLYARQLDYGYRKSVYMKNGFVITGVSIKLEKGNKEDMKEKMDELMQRRLDKQPLEYPSAGSIFKRPEGHFAGALIEECGLKGFCIGGACVSEKHAGFIINKGNATTKDILALIDYIQKTVFEKTNVQLETEIKVLGS